MASGAARIVFVLSLVLWYSPGCLVAENASTPVVLNRTCIYFPQATRLNNVINITLSVCYFCTGGSESYAANDACPAGGNFFCSSGFGEIDNGTIRGELPQFQHSDSTIHSYRQLAVMTFVMLASQYPQTLGLSGVEKITIHPNALCAHHNGTRSVSRFEHQKELWELRNYRTQFGKSMFYLSCLRPFYSCLIVLGVALALRAYTA